MLEKILKLIASEDSERLFTGDNHPNIYDAVSANSNLDDMRELERTLKHYFEQVMQVSPSTSRVYYEAQRILSVCERAFSAIKGNGTERISAPQIRDINDEIVDFYLESLKHFASSINENILHEHIKYLEDE